MHKCMDNLDWSLVRAFLAVAETGSLSAAARITGHSQPTLGRQIRTLEAQLGTELFHRIARGLELTEAGAALIDPAREMAAAAARLALTAEGRSDALAGTVRITASNMVSHHLLPPVLARIRQVEPLIQIELAPSDASENLLFREADIALRMYRPEQIDIVARRLADLPMGFYAARSYIARHGRPQTLAEALQLDIVGLDRSDLMLRVFRAAGLAAQREAFAVRCDHQPTLWELVRAGCGIGANQRRIGDADPLVERLPDFPELPLPPLELWIAAPQALRTTPRLRRVWDLLVAEFG